MELQLLCKKDHTVSTRIGQSWGKRQLVVMKQIEPHEREMRMSNWWGDHREEKVS